MIKSQIGGSHNKVHRAQPIRAVPIKSNYSTYQNSIVGNNQRNEFQSISMSLNTNDFRNAGFQKNVMGNDMSYQNKNFGYAQTSQFNNDFN